MCDFCMAALRSWNKSENPRSCRNHTFPNEVHHQSLESTTSFIGESLNLTAVKIPVDHFRVSLNVLAM